MAVNILRYPTDADWERAYDFALRTIGRRYAGGGVSDKWKHKILRAGHSPIRTLMFTIEMVDIPYYVSVHFVRHKYGVEHYVQSQRNDRQSDYDRTKAPQDEPVTHTMDMNAQELIFMAGMRLCGQAYHTTQLWMLEIVREVLKTNPEFKPFLVPKCLQHGGVCNEFEPCGINGICGADVNAKAKIIP